MPNSGAEQTHADRKNKIASAVLRINSLRIDSIFTKFLFAQWALAVVCALLISPYTYSGSTATVHPHVYLAFFFGGLISIYPYFVFTQAPGSVLSRYVIATAQMFFSMLLIHVTNGRIETHFHIFVSLAFLAAYFDRKILIYATVFTALDHVLRGIYLPQSVYGVLIASPFRAFEHSAWVLFEDLFLLYSMKTTLDGVNATAERQLSLEFAIVNVEHVALERTQELEATQKKVTHQQQILVASSKMSALGEMAGGIAHEINTPLGAIALMTGELDLLADDATVDRKMLKDTSRDIRSTVDRIAAIVKALRAFSRDGQYDPVVESSLMQIVTDTLSLSKERLTHNGIELKFDERELDTAIRCRPTEISQVLLNLLGNSLDAIADRDEKWILLECQRNAGMLEIGITDSGDGIPLPVREKLMQPFFTTKEVGKGTGLGLSISRSIAAAHGGELVIDSQSKNTRFVLRLPLTPPAQRKVA